MKYYTCEYCYKEFEPKRRRVQKYCSNTCRSKAFHARKTSSKSLTKNLKLDNSIKVPEIITPPSKTKIESISFAGISNATFGSLAASSIKSAFTSENKKAATKGDLKAYTNAILGRYHLVKNIPRRQSDGAMPYYDMETNEVVYSIWSL